MLLKIESLPGTPHYIWREGSPCSEKVTRVLGVIMAEEKRSVLTKALLWMQEKEEAIKNSGVTIDYLGGEYTFLPEFVDRNDKKLARLLTG